MKKSACAAAFAAAFLAGAASRLKLGPWRERKTPPGAVLERLDLPYGPGESQRFDLYLPRELNKKTCGLVVYLHAGGFTAGDKREDADILRRIAAKGFAAAGVNYTLRTDGENRRFAVYYMELEPGSRWTSEAHMRGTVEFITVFSGELELETAGRSLRVGARENLRFPADSEHTYANAGEGVCTLEMILYNP